MTQQIDSLLCCFNSINMIENYEGYLKFGIGIVLLTILFYYLVENNKDDNDDMHMGMN